MLPNNLLIAVTFFYKESRLDTLSRTIKNFANLGNDVDVFIFTNTSSKAEHDNIYSLFPSHIKPTICVPNFLGHPFLLTWCHLSIFREKLNNRDEITHFMYIEDDIEVKKENIEYWMEGRIFLDEFDMYPSFLRYEIKDKTSELVSVDVTEPQQYASLPKVFGGDGAVYLNIHYPYQGMYLLDRRLMTEHLEGISSNPDFGKWSIREKSAQGLTFANVRNGFWSRNCLKFNPIKMTIEKNALVRHLTNNYTPDPSSPFGKINIDNLII